MLNKVTLIGRLGMDPELRVSQNGIQLCRMRVAVSEVFKDGNGEKAERTDWFTVVSFAKTAENCSRFLRKGNLVAVDGRLQTREWQDPQNGQKHTSIEVKGDRVVFLDTKAQRERDAREDQPGVRNPIFDGGRAEPEPQRPKSDGYLEDMPW